MALWALLLGLHAVAHRPRLLLQQHGTAPATLAYNDSSADDPMQRAALMAIYNATGGTQWAWTAGSSRNSSSSMRAWGGNSSYCMWFGVTCHASSPLDMTCMDCGPRSVVVLSLDSFGAVGTLPPDVGQLPQLTVLGLTQNPGLTGTLPTSMTQLTQLLWLSLTVRAVARSHGGRWS